MKINEVITKNSKITRTIGNSVEIDHGDGTKTTVDTKKNPQAIQRDASGKLKVNTQPKNSAMAQKKKQAQSPKPGEKVEIEQ